MADLITLARAKIALPSITDNTQDATISTLITAISALVEKYCQRQFTAQTYDEIYDSDGSGSLLLRNFPVLGISRLSMSPSPVLKVWNTNAAASRATVSTQNAAGDWPQPTVGLTLTLVVNGVTTVTNAVLWATCPTVAQVAAAVNAMGNGWNAVATGGYGAWASSDITPLVGPRNATGGGSTLDAHVTDLSDFDVVPETGEVRFTGNLTGVFGTGWVPGDPGWVQAGTNLPRGGRNVRVAYTAGFDTVPPDIQTAVALWVAFTLFYPVTAVGYSGEKYEDYRYTIAQISQDPPPAVKPTLLLYKDRKL